MAPQPYSSPTVTVDTGRGLETVPEPPHPRDGDPYRTSTSLDSAPRRHTGHTGKPLSCPDPDHQDPFVYKYGTIPLELGSGPKSSTRRDPVPLSLLTRAYRTLFVHVSSLRPSGDPKPDTSQPLKVCREVDGGEDCGGR